jgi:hypothetical protein
MLFGSIGKRVESHHIFLHHTFEGYFNCVRKQNEVNVKINKFIWSKEKALL